MGTFHAFADTLFSRLVWTSAQAVLLVGVVWLVGRFIPKLPSATRCMLWWLLGAQLILGLAIAAPVKLPWLPGAPQTAIADISSSRLVFAIAPEASATTFATLMQHQVPVHAIAPASEVSTPANWRLALICLWLAGVLSQLLLMARDWRKAHAMLRNSTPLRDPVLHAMCAAQARALGLQRPPALRTSHAIVSPQVTGVWRPIVLLPADHSLTPEESALALAHELIHLHRGDLWMCWIPAIAQRLFFFHPLVAWAVREYALSREAACDAQVMQQTATEPQAYGQLLLRLGVAHPMYSGLAGASPSFQNLKRRLIMLQQNDNLSRHRARGWLLIAAIALAGVVPYRVTANTADHAAGVSIAADGSAMRQTAPPAPPASPTPPVPPAPTPPMPPPQLPPPPPPPPPRNTQGFTARHIDIDTTTNATYGFALMDGDSITINGSDADVESVKQLRKRNEPVLWFRRGSKSYVVRDSAYIQRAKVIYAPITAYGKRQGALGGEQGFLGSQQAGLGARQSALGARQAQLARQQAQLASEQAAIAGQPADSRREAEFRAKEATLQAGENEIDRQQKELGQRQDALGKQQRALGAKQHALGNQQEQATAQADQQIGQLIDEAIAKGIAQTLSPG